MQFVDWLTQLARIALPCVLAVFLQLSPVMAQVSTGLQDGYAAEQNGNTLKAAESYARVSALQPWRTGLSEKAGLLFYQNNDLENTLLNLQAAMDKGDLSAQGQATLGEAFFRMQKFDSALLVWTELINGSKVDESVFGNIADKLASIGYVEEQAAVYRQWLEQYPGNSSACMRLGLIQTVYDPLEAVTWLSLAKSLDPSLTEEADAMLDTLAGLQDADERYRLVMTGRTLGSLGEWQIAGEAFQKAVDLDPEYGDAWAFLAESRQQLGLPVSDTLDKANRLSPDSIGVKILTALYWRRQNQPEKALEIMQEISDLQPGEYVWLIEMGNITAQSGDLEGAYKYYRQAIDAEPDNPQWQKELITFCLQNSYQIRTIALPAAREYLKLDREGPQSLAMMGRVMLELRDALSAERYLLRALNLDGSNAAAHLYLGQVYLMEADQEQAYNQFMAAQSLASIQPEVAQLARRLVDQYFAQGAANTP